MLVPCVDAIGGSFFTADNDQAEVFGQLQILDSESTSQFMPVGRGQIDNRNPLFVTVTQKVSSRTNHVIGAQHHRRAVRERRVDFFRAQIKRERSELQYAIVRFDFVSRGGGQSEIRQRAMLDSNAFGVSRRT